MSAVDARRLPTLANPQSIRSVADEILVDAGGGRAALTEMVRKRLRVIDDALDATETKFFSYEGAVVETREVIDHRTRLAAGGDLDDIVGLKRSKSADDKAGKQPITVNVMVNGPEARPGIWARAAEVIDAEH